MKIIDEREIQKKKKKKNRKHRKEQEGRETMWKGDMLCLLCI